MTKPPVFPSFLHPLFIRMVPVYQEIQQIRRSLSFYFWQPWILTVTAESANFVFLVFLAKTGNLGQRDIIFRNERISALNRILLHSLKCTRTCCLLLSPNQAHDKNLRTLYVIWEICLAPSCFLCECCSKPSFWVGNYLLETERFVPYQFEDTVMAGTLFYKIFAFSFGSSQSCLWLKILEVFRNSLWGTKWRLGTTVNTLMKKTNRL